MAVYIRLANTNLSPITVGSLINPTTVNWNRMSPAKAQDVTGNWTRGTNLWSWLKNNDPVFSAFVTTNFLGMQAGTYNSPLFLSYGENNTTGISFRMETGFSGGGLFIRFSAYVGTTAQSGYYERKSESNYPLYGITSSAIARMEELLNGNNGFFFVVTPHIQDSPEYMAVVQPFTEEFRPYMYSGSPTPYDRFWDFYDGNNPTSRISLLRNLFQNSGQDTGPDSDEDGGWGDFNDGTDTITLPGVPGISALSAGFVNMYNPSSAQLQVLVNALWSNDISQVFWKMFTDPMESLVSLQIFPVAPEVTPASVNIVMGNVTLQDQSTTPITFALAPALTNQYKIIDCGSLQMNEYWGSALDYSPYTKAEIFLPYIGVKEIDINDVMAATLHLQYIVDFLTGTCTAQLECVKAQHIDFSAPLYHWQGNMAMAVPASASDMSQLITSIASTLVSAGLTVATGGSGAAIASGIAGGALNMANAHPRIEKGGTIAMTAGALDNQTPFIILTRPIQSKPAGFENYKGWPSNITAEIGSLSGYTEVEYVHVEVAGATDEERNEIERLLKEGVII